MRTRYWGLYNYENGKWIADDAHGTYMIKPRHRRRHTTYEAAQSDANYGWVPRPFYVVTKPRKLPPEAQAVIDAVKRYDACGVGWKAVIDALRAYEPTC